MEFRALLSTQVSHRREAELTEGSGSDQTGRVGLNLSWLFNTQRSSLVASFSPYYEEFFQDSTLSTYGASAGLGYTRRSSPAHAWTITGSLEATPEQDVPRAPTSAEPQDPRLRVLVPRNGYIASSVGLGTEHRAGARTRFSTATEVGSIRYSAYSVENSATGSGLVDEDRLSTSVEFQRDTSSRSTFTANLGATFYSLEQSQMAAAQDKGRGQYSLSVGANHRAGPRSAFFYKGGFSAIETSDGGIESTPSAGAGWNLEGERLSSGISMEHSQQIFPGSQTSVDSSAVAGRFGARLSQASRLELGAGYGLSEESAAGPGTGGDTRDRNITVSYNRSGEVLGWSIAVSHARQRSDAAFGRDLEATSISGGLTWRLTRRRGPA